MKRKQNGTVCGVVCGLCKCCVVVRRARNAHTHASCMVQGINEMQTVANMAGTTSVQRRVRILMLMMRWDSSGDV